MKGIALGGVARAKGASRGSARGDGTSCAVRGGGEAVRDGGSNGSRARRKEKQGRRRCSASWREEEAPARKGVGLGETREAWRRSNRRRGRPVGGETGGGGAAETPVKLEVGDEVEHLIAICEKSRGLSAN